MLRDMTNAVATHAEAARAAIIAKIDRCKLARDIADSGIGRAALSDSMFVGRLRRGENVTLDKLNRLELWLDTALAAALATGSSQIDRDAGVRS
jgi:hypothetical protein